MKKSFVILLCLAVFTGLAMAQTYAPGSTGGIFGVDKLGAHSNGGRGCTGCHAPHSGGAGAGGNAGTGSPADTNMGNFALWGQDMGPLYGKTLGFGDSGQYQLALPAMSAFSGDKEEIVDIMTCLSCHDGNIARGAMMTNQSWEQKMNLLPTGAGGHALYGPNPIPTLLGSDGTTAGNYNNDHPVGPQANLKAVGVSGNFQYVSGGCTWHGTASDCLKIAPTATKYQAFANHYGAPNIISNGHGSPVVLPDSNPDNAYLTCGTCHTPHSMYTAGDNVDAPIAGNAPDPVSGKFTAKTYITYFFIAAPYNPGSQPSASQASSATQFCRQCHFTGAGGSNEGSGINSVTTAF